MKTPKQIVRIYLTEEESKQVIEEAKKEGYGFHEKAEFCKILLKRGISHNHDIQKNSYTKKKNKRDSAFKSGGKR